FFFQAEDGIRDFHVTGVQTCALPISACSPMRTRSGQWQRCSRDLTPLGWNLGCLDRYFRRVLDGSIRLNLGLRVGLDLCRLTLEIGRASCRERVEIPEVGGRGEERSR